MKLTDPTGLIGKIKARMPRDCSVRKNTYCDQVISLRLQGQTYEKIRDWLFDKGPEHSIPTPTLYRNLSKAIRDAELNLPEAEKLFEAWGGTSLGVPIDLVREIEGQIVLQRRRIDSMIYDENERKRIKPGYSHPRIRQEMETLVSLVGLITKLTPRGGEIPEGQGTVAPSRPQLTPEVEAVLLEMVLTGKLKLPGPVVQEGPGDVG